MQTDLSDPTHEAVTLQRCMNDLVSVLALQAMWTGGEPSQIVSTMVDALLGMLNLDLIYVRLKDSAEDMPIETLRVARALEPVPHPQDIAKAFTRTMGGDSRKWPSAIRGRFGNRDISLAPLRLGLQDEIGVLVAGSFRPDFPRQTESLLLNVGANQALIGLREARQLHEQKRIADELERRVEERTAGLAAANEELRKEITERKKIEERLRESEALLKRSEDNLSLIINTMPTLAWSARPDGSADFFNQHYLDYTGLTADEAQEWGWTATIHAEDMGRLTIYWQSIMNSGEPAEIEARIRRFDGMYRWFLLRANALRDESGAIVKWYGTNTDIDDRKRAEEQVRRSEAFLSEAQQLTRIGSFSWRVATGEIKWSEQLYRIFGFEMGQPVTFDRISSRVHPEDLPLIYDMIEKAQHSVSDFEYEHRLLMADQSVKHLHLIGHAIRDREGQLEYVGAVQDVTRRQLAEAAWAKGRSELATVTRATSLDVLTASIAHEVNQPLSGIVTNASTCLRMLDGDPPNIEGARETARRTIRDGNRASDVIARLRTLFGKKEVNAEPVDLNEATREVIALSLRELQRNRVVLTNEFAENLPTVKGDRVQLQQVILNLLRNALDAMSHVDDRPRQLLIRTEPDGEQVRFTIQDTGVGFELEAADRLFESFYTTKHDGMGIGLSVSRSIIEAHHGRLWATRNDGPGSIFAFSIPCEGSCENDLMPAQRQ